MAHPHDLTHQIRLRVRYLLSHRLRRSSSKADLLAACRASMSFVTCDLGIVVVTYNSEHVVSGLLDSLTAGLAGVEADVIVVDNDSIDGTVTLLECRDNVVVLRSENHGYAAGINRGVAELPDAKAILVLNPDVRLAPGAVPALLASLQLPNTGIVAPRVVDGHGALHRSMRREPTLGRALGLGRTGIPWLSEYVSEADAYAQPQVADWALGAALLISRHCFDALGGWDESFFLYSEETDFCLRARDMGLLTRYTPAAEVMHIRWPVRPEFIHARYADSQSSASLSASTQRNCIIQLLPSRGRKRTVVGRARQPPLDRSHPGAFEPFAQGGSA